MRKGISSLCGVVHEKMRSDVRNGDVFIFLFNETTAYVALAIIGLIFTLTHPIWLRHIYKRMMRRKYANLEGFHASRWLIINWLHKKVPCLQIGKHS